MYIKEYSTAMIVRYIMQKLFNFILIYRYMVILASLDKTTLQPKPKPKILSSTFSVLFYTTEGADMICIVEYIDYRYIQ